MGYILGLLSQLEQNLHFIELENNDLLNRAAQSVEVCDIVFRQIKQQIVKKGFKDPNEEINFFKYIKPRF